MKTIISDKEIARLNRELEFIRQDIVRLSAAMAEYGTEHAVHMQGVLTRIIDAVSVIRVENVAINTRLAALESWREMQTGDGR